MHDAAKNTSGWEQTTARQRALRRAERIDVVVAAMLLVLLTFGWAIRLTPFDHWPRGDFLIAATTRHV